MEKWFNHWRQIDGEIVVYLLYVYYDESKTQILALSTSSVVFASHPAPPRLFRMVSPTKLPSQDVMYSHIQKKKYLTFILTQNMFDINLNFLLFLRNKFLTDTNVKMKMNGLH